jgi:hypothetical protein
MPQTVPGWRYTLQVSDTLMTDSWTTAAVLEGENVVQWGTGGQIAVTAATGGTPRKFFRWIVEDPDTDADGLGDWFEMQIGSSVTSNDSDGDGYSDSVEWGGGFDPLADSSNPGASGGGAHWETSWAFASATHTVTKLQDDAEGNERWSVFQRWTGLPSGDKSEIQIVTGSKPPFPPLPEPPEFSQLDFSGWTPHIWAPGDNELSTTTRFTDTPMTNQEYREFIGNWYRVRMKATYPSLHALVLYMLLEKTSAAATYPPPTPDVINRSLVTVQLPAGATQSNVVDLPLAVAQGTDVKVVRKLEFSLSATAPGDYVDSVFEGGERHFVTPKWAQDIDGEFNKKVVVKAGGLSAADISPTVLDGNNQPVTNPDQKLEWLVSPADAGTLDPADPTKFIVDRETARHVVVSIVPKGAAASGAAKLNVWVVWCEMAATLSGTPKFVNALGNVSARIGNNAFDAGAGVRWTATIKPIDLVTGDRPSLESQEQVPVIGDGGGVASQDAEDGSGAAFSGWDMTRSITVRVWKTNSLLQVPENPINSADISFQKKDYPTNHVQGNDDSRVDDEDNDPYVLGESPVGTVMSEDFTETLVPDDKRAIGQVHPSGPYNGDKVHLKYWYRDFVRLQIGRHWYRVSDHGMWRFHFFLERQDGHWERLYPEKFDATNEGIDNISSEPTP